jgi:hypothetical protein
MRFTESGAKVIDFAIWTLQYLEFFSCGVNNFPVFERAVLHQVSAEVLCGGILGCCVGCEF